MDKATELLNRFLELSSDENGKIAELILIRKSAKTREERIEKLSEQGDKDWVEFLRKCPPIEEEYAFLFSPMDKIAQALACDIKGWQSKSEDAALRVNSSVDPELWNKEKASRDIFLRHAIQIFAHSKTRKYSYWFDFAEEFRNEGLTPLDMVLWPHDHR